MQYRDLIQFEPIESVIQLKDAGAAGAARELVSSYVISEEMAERLITLVIPQLQFARPADNKGLLIVGNYGTGKSHLMSVLSAVAEHADLVPLLRSAAVATAASAIGGRFKVVRTELGATEMGFRDFVCSQLEIALEKWDITYQFPPVDSIPNHKGAFEAMMAAFQARYPDQGILFVVDEFLDYLRGRGDTPLIKDLGFLRELGEVCKDLRFRFMAGVQETLFDSDRFAFVASSLNRVKDRFEQVFIARSDVKYVVAERLLRKNAEQLTLVRAHLTPFAPFYGSMNERMDEFVRLFPIHPDYIDIFARITLAEKREVLRTLSRAMQSRLDQEVPVDAPGLIAYDSYWETLRQDAAFRTVPEIREVIDVSQVLEERVRQAFTRPAYRPMAIRIIHALSVARLTTGNVNAPLGVTAEELRDGLCLYDPAVAAMHGEPAPDLLTQVNVVLKAIITTVNSQYITFNRDNQQYYLDLAKTVDYDALIEKRAGSLDEAALDRGYFAALARVMECADQSYVPNYPIWQYELEWKDRKVMRQGYLFFGAPNERSTAQPERDFYLYFLQPYQPPLYRDEKKADEVFFRLQRSDDSFLDALKHYAAALELIATSSGEAKSVYQRKAEQALQAVVKWLHDHMVQAFDVTYHGSTRALAQWLKNLRGGNPNVRDLVNNVGSLCLAAHFQDLAPDYPRFTTLITEETRAPAAADALRWIRGIVKPKRGADVLDALELLEDTDKLRPDHSRYARQITQALSARPPGHVLNRADLIKPVAQDVEYMAPHTFRLEPEWVAVLLAALVANGSVVLALAGQKFDANNLDALVSTPIKDLAAFKHVERPRDWNLPALTALFETLGLAAGQAQAVTQGSEDAVQALQQAVTQRTAGVVLAQQQLQEGFVFWGKSMLDEQEQTRYRTRLVQAKAFLESLQPYTSAGKLKNLKHDIPEILTQAPNLAAVKEVDAIAQLCKDLAPSTAYLQQAETALPENHPWVADAKVQRSALQAAASDPGKRGTPAFRQDARTILADLRARYITDYMNLHTQARLGANDDKRKASLLHDQRLTTLRALKNIDLLPGNELSSLENLLVGLKSCWSLTAAELQTNAICPHCSFRPVAEIVPRPASIRLQEIDTQLDTMLASWTSSLLTNLEDPITSTSLALLPPDQRSAVTAFISTGTLPPRITPAIIQSFQQVLRGLVKVVISRDALAVALSNGGAAATPNELEKRFKDYLQHQIAGHEQATVRIVIE